MKLITWLRRIINTKKGIYQIWDTSAISCYLTDFMNITNSNNNITVVVPEGVIHELSSGRRRYQVCKQAYDFLQGKNKKVIREVADDKIRGWTIDEQVVYVSDMYVKKGYTVELVTCDRDQALKAELKNIKCKLLPAVKKESTNDVKSSKVVTINKAKEVEEETKLQDEIKVPYTMKGNEFFIDVNLRISVYDNKGRRRSGRDNLLNFKLSDSFENNNNKYYLKSITKDSIVLKLKT